MSYKILFYISLAVFLICSVWFSISYFSRHGDNKIILKNDTLITTEYGPDLNHDGKLDTTKHVVVIQPKPDSKIDWTALAGVISSFILGAAALIINYIKERKTKINIPVVNNKKHPLFIKLDEMRLRDLTSLKLGTEGRTELFQVMITDQVDSYFDCITLFLDSEQKFESIHDVRIKCRKLVLDIASEYEHRWKNHDIPKIVIDRYKELHKDKIQTILYSIDNETFGVSEVDYQKFIYSFLFSITIILSSFLSPEIQTVLKDLNGSIKKLTFRGKSLG